VGALFIKHETKIEKCTQFFMINKKQGG